MILKRKKNKIKCFKNVKQINVDIYEMFTNTAKRLKSFGKALGPNHHLHMFERMMILPMNAFVIFHIGAEVNSIQIAVTKIASINKII